MYRIDIDALKDFTCVSPYFVRDEDFNKGDDCLCMMLLDENMLPLSESKAKEFTEALNKAVVDYCYDTPFRSEGNALFGKGFVPIPINEDTLEYSIMYILYMASLKAEQFGYNGIAVLAIEGNMDGRTYKIWHCLSVEKSGTCYSEVWTNTQQDNDGNSVYVNDMGEVVSLNDVAALLEDEFDFDAPAIMDDTLKKVLEMTMFE